MDDEFTKKDLKWFIPSVGLTIALVFFGLKQFTGAINSESRSYHWECSWEDPSGMKQQIIYDVKNWKGDEYYHAFPCPYSPKLIP